jgi:hypothetical protein
MRCFVAVVALLPSLTFGFGQQQPELQRPVIDVHMHGGAGRGESDEAFLQRALTELDKHNIVLALTGVTDPERYADTWRKAAPGRIVVGPQLSGRGDLPDVGWLSAQFHKYDDVF